MVAELGVPAPLAPAAPSPLGVPLGDTLGPAASSQRAGGQGGGDAAGDLAISMATDPQLGAGVPPALAETPILLLHLEPSRMSAAVNLSFLSPTSEAAFCFPPGVYFEQRREVTEFVRVGAPLGQLEVKAIDVQLHMPLFVTRYAAAQADHKADGTVGKAARASQPTS